MISNVFIIESILNICLYVVNAFLNFAYVKDFWYFVLIFSSYFLQDVRMQRHCICMKYIADSMHSIV